MKICWLDLCRELLSAISVRVQNMGYVSMLLHYLHNQQFQKLQHVLTTRQTTQAAHKALALLTCTRSDCSPNVTKEINGHKPKGLKADNIDRSGSRYHLYYQNALALRVSHALNFTYVKSWQVPLHEEGRAQLKIFQKVTHIEAFI